MQLNTCEMCGKDYPASNKLCPECNQMQPEQEIQLTNLLQLFIDVSGMDRIEAVKQAQSLLDTINGKVTSEIYYKCLLCDKVTTNPTCRDCDNFVANL